MLEATVQPACCASWTVGIGHENGNLPPWKLKESEGTPSERIVSLSPQQIRIWCCLGLKKGERREVPSLPADLWWGALCELGRWTISTQQQKEACLARWKCLITHHRSHCNYVQDIKQHILKFDLLWTLIKAEGVSFLNPALCGQSCSKSLCSSPDFLPKHTKLACAFDGCRCVLTLLDGRQSPFTETEQRLKSEQENYNFSTSSADTSFASWIHRLSWAFLMVLSHGVSLEYFWKVLKLFSLVTLSIKKKKSTSFKNWTLRKKNRCHNIVRRMT